MESTVICTCVLILDIDCDCLLCCVKTCNFGCLNSIGYILVVVIIVIGGNGKCSKINYIGNGDDVAYVAGSGAVNVGNDLCITAPIGFCQLSRRYGYG